MEERVWSSITARHFQLALSLSLHHFQVAPPGSLCVSPLWPDDPFLSPFPRRAAPSHQWPGAPRGASSFRTSVSLHCSLSASLIAAFYSFIFEALRERLSCLPAAALPSPVDTGRARGRGAPTPPALRLTIVLPFVSDSCHVSPASVSDSDSHEEGLYGRVTGRAEKGRAN